MTTDRAFGVAVMLLALAFILFAVPSIDDDWKKAVGARYFTVGPRYYPYLAGILCFVFGALIVLKPQAWLPDFTPPTSPAGRRAGLVLAISAAYVALVPLLGFEAASFFMLAAFLYAFGVRRWAMLISVSVLAPVAVSLIFLKIFALKLPSGLLPLPF
ncbi:MAG: tripartite tricarboxylate transporter TctB family protein [Proteobacteria bacterium]|nr:tripartite tricarboxylate transporter TctB family protein [Pseudomonadota bacterium]